MPQAELSRLAQERPLRVLLVHAGEPDALTWSGLVQPLRLAAKVLGPIGDALGKERVMSTCLAVLAVAGAAYLTGNRALAWLAVVAMLGLRALQRHTLLGRAMRAVADDHQAALSVGISLRFIWVMVWSIAGFVALVAGIMWGTKSGVQFSLSLIALLTWINLSAQVILIATSFIYTLDVENADRVRTRFGATTFAQRRVQAGAGRHLDLALVGHAEPAARPVGDLVQLGGVGGGKSWGGGCFRHAGVLRRWGRLAVRGVRNAGKNTLTDAVRNRGA